MCNPDDNRLEKYRRLLSGVEESEILVVPGGRRGMCDSLNQSYDILRSDLGFAVGFMGDDHRPRTRGWDAQYYSALAGNGVGLVYGDDLIQGERIPTQVAMTSSIPAALGYMVPPEFQHLYVDNVWKDWGTSIRRLTYLPEVVVEHVHPLAGKAVMDANYTAVNSSAVANADKLAYDEYNSSGRFYADVLKLKELL